MKNALKRNKWRSKAYLEWVKELPCSICGVEPCGDAHHIKGVGNLSGAGLTAPDWAVMPLCRKHHTEMHVNTKLWVDQWRYIALTLGRAIDENILEC